MRLPVIGRAFTLPTVLLVLTGITLAGCGDTDTTNGPNEATGTLRVQLVDAPSCIEGLEHLYLVLGDVRVHQDTDADDGSGWYSVMPDTLTEEERTVDLLELVNGVSALLGEEDLPAGLYTQARLVLEDSWMVVDGDSIDVTVPSGSQSGLKLIGEFNVDPGVLTELTIDWDACRSLLETPPGSGRWKLKPVLRTVETIISGSISGTVLPLDIGAAVLAVSSDLSDSTITQVDPVSGGYTLMVLPAGVWDITAFAPGYVDSTVTGITVEAGMDSSGHDFTLVSETP